MTATAPNAIPAPMENRRTAMALCSSGTPRTATRRAASPPIHTPTLLKCTHWSTMFGQRHGPVPAPAWLASVCASTAPRDASPRIKKGIRRERVGRYAAAATAAPATPIGSALHHNARPSGVLRRRPTPTPASIAWATPSVITPTAASAHRPQR